MSSKFSRGVAVVMAVVATAASTTARAESLEDVLTKDLFGGKFEVASGLAVDIVGGETLGQDIFQQTFATIGQSIGSGVTSSVPLPSTSAGFTYEFDKDLDLFVRSTDSLGPFFSERSQTLGQGKFAVTFAYTHVTFNTFDGNDLDGFTTIVPAGATLVTRAANELPGIGDDVIAVRFSEFDINVNNFAFFFTYGLLDDLDLTFGMPLVNVAMKGNATAQISDPQNDSGPADSLNRLQFEPVRQEANGGGKVATNRQSVTDSFDDSAFGVGDIILRGKYRFLQTEYVDLAGLVTFTIPTGGADDFRGYHDPTGTPALVLSKAYGFVAPHLNLGYAFRSKEDVSQFVWAAGAEVRATDWMTVVPDFLGYDDTQTRGNTKTDAYQFSIGAKFNPWQQLILGVNLQFPLNDEGLRSDVIYTGEIQYTF